MTADAISKRPPPADSGMRSFASSLTRRWVAFYTHGVHPDAADRRRTEIDSDLWEQQAEASASGTHPLRLAMDVAGRLLRGMPADIAWRSRMEGSFVSIHIPANRGVGLLFFLTIALIFIATSIPGYDTAREGWEGEMRRLDDMSTTATNVTVAFQVLAGIALIAAAGAFAHLLRAHNQLLASVSGYGLAAAGVLTLGTSAMYVVMVELSRQWAENPSANAAVGDTARAFGVAMDRFGGAGSLALILSVGAMALTTARAHLVPGWAIWLPAIGVPVFVAGALMGVSDAADDFVWISMGVGLMTSVIWLIVAGISLVWRNTITPPTSDAPAPA